MDKTVYIPVQQISRYRIDGVLGSGAMGAVYLGYDDRIDRAVAIKVLHPHLREGTQGAELELRFLQEARAAARCLHPNIVTVFDFGTEADTPFIVMEYVDGTELKAHLENDTEIAPASAIDICIQILGALGHAHDKGVIHRDIKPANIILLENGVIKVSDFGVARLDTSDLTGTGLMVGTPNYMSPEGFRGEVVDARSDLYSVGVLFYQLLTRQRPVREMPLEQTLAKLDEIVGLSARNVHSLKSILRSALQYDPAARFQSAADFLAALKNIEDMDLAAAGSSLFPTLVKRPRPDAAPAPGSDSVSQWGGDVLQALEQSLARHVGPMAKLLIKKQSRVAGSLEELVAELTRHIPNEDERSQFRKALDRSGISSAGGSVVSSAPDNSAVAAQLAGNILSSAVEDKIAQLLAFYIGPLAGRVVRRAHKTATDTDSLLRHLAGQIPDERERSEFLDKARRAISSVTP